MDARGIAPIFLLAPTTPDARIEEVAQLARGYVYYVSLKGVTGAGNLDTADVARKLAEIRRHVKLPVGVGFGIRDAAERAGDRRARRRGGDRQPPHPGDRERSRRPTRHRARAPGLLPFAARARCDEPP